jgi:hypothetical protein
LDGIGWVVVCVVVVPVACAATSAVGLAGIAGVAGVAGTAGTAGVVGVAGIAGVAGVAGTAGVGTVCAIAAGIAMAMPMASAMSVRVRPFMVVSSWNGPAFTAMRGTRSIRQHACIRTDFPEEKQTFHVIFNAS